MGATCTLTADASASVTCVAGSNCSATMGAGSSLTCEQGATCEAICTSTCSASNQGGTLTLKCAGDPSAKPVTAAGECK